MPRKNIYLVAEEAGVSVATISRYFSNPKIVGKSTRDKIEKICKKHNYRPSRFAQAVKTRKMRTIALITPVLIQLKLLELIDSVESNLAKHGYNLNLFNFNLNHDRQVEILKSIDERTIDGVIMAGGGISGGDQSLELLNIINSRGLPVVFTEGRLNNSKIPSAIVDSYHGGKIAAEYLIKNNHKKIGIITREIKYSIMKSRVDGFVDALNKSKIKEKFIMEIACQKPTKDFNYIKDYFEENTKKIIEKDITAIYATMDPIAIYLIDYMGQSGIKIPGDISVIGFDNQLFSELTSPKLTTIDNDLAKLGKIAVDNLVNKIEKGKYKNIENVVIPTLVERQSVATL